MNRPQLVRRIGELRADLARVRAKARRGGGARKVLAELQVHQEELRVQNEELRGTQASLEQSRQRYADLYDFAPIGYITLDAQGLIEEINLTATAILGLERSMVLGTPMLVYVAESDRQAVLDHLRKCRTESSALVDSDLRLCHATGRLIPVRLSSRHEVSRDHGRFRTVIVDLTERQEAERERVEVARRQAADQAASQAKDRFLATLSHELRTPLTPVLAEVSVLEDSPDLPPRLRHAFQLIRRNIELEARLVDDLLDLAGIASGKLRFTLGVVDAHSVVHEVREMIDEERSQKQQELRLELAAPMSYVSADGTRLRQVIWNLLSNAIRFTPACGRIVVSTRNDSPQELSISVTDSGIGIEPNPLERIFEPFEQAGRTGGRLGLSLTISRGIVEAMGGRITAASAGAGKGATFEVRLAAAPAPGDRPPAALSPSTKPRRLRILLVEDHEDTARVLARLLRLRGHDVRVATSIQTAASALHDELAPPDLLLSDIGLPDGSGLELPSRLPAIADVKLKVVLSGYGSEEDVARSRQAGFDEHLTKPIDFRRLLEVIGRLTPSK